MMNKESIGTEDDMCKAHDHLMGGKQHGRGPMVELVAMTKPEGLEAREVTRRGRGSGNPRPTMAATARRVHRKGVSSRELRTCSGPGSQGGRRRMVFMAARHFSVKIRDRVRGRAAIQWHIRRDVRLWKVRQVKEGREGRGR